MLCLSSAISLVKKFPLVEALRVIVNCARKSDMSLWKKFFSVAEDPKELYKVMICNLAILKCWKFGDCYLISYYYTNLGVPSCERKSTLI